MATQNIYKLALNSLSAHVAILDQEGVIIETNRAWQEFARENGMVDNPSSVGENYLTVCEQASRSDNDEPAVIARAIRKVISGAIKEFFINYPCHSPQQERWYALRVVPFREPRTTGKVVLTHEDITPLIQAQRTLRKNESLLQEQAAKLTESNIALKVLLKHREDDRKQLEDNVLANIRELVLPYVERLLEGGLAAREQVVTEIIRDRLHEIASPFLNRLTSLKVILTPQEINVATMVREGKTSKEIADIMMISTSAVDFHRKHIRKKLGLTRGGGNLRSHLLSMQ